MNIDPIGYIQTPYKEKFAIPRQPGLVSSAKGIIKMTAPYADINAFRGIEQFSHLWLIFQFHQVEQGKWTPLVRPPRLGGNDKLGVFATRSTHRPSNMGMSVVSFDKVEQRGKNVLVHVSGVDLMDGTPILDIKPYIAYVDSIPNAQSGFADTAPTTHPVEFSEPTVYVLNQLKKNHPELEQLITDTLAFNPSPAYHNKQDENRVYGVKLLDFNVTWRLHNGIVVVIGIERI